MPRTWFDVTEAAAELGMSPDSVYALCASGQLGHSRVGPNRGRIRITRANIERYLQSCEIEPHAPAQPDPVKSRPMFVRLDGEPLRHFKI